MTGAWILLYLWAAWQSGASSADLSCQWPSAPCVLRLVWVRSNSPCFVRYLPENPAGKMGLLRACVSCACMALSLRFWSAVFFSSVSASILLSKSMSISLAARCSQLFS
uniref:Putative rna helicase n=1 Tax=Ixodes ricinus TaxID=34613 RepID=A0A0K8R6I9_IXORI